MAKRTDPIALAKRALADVLTRAIGSQDDDRILTSAKQVLSMLDKPTAPADPAAAREDRVDLDYLTAEEMNLFEMAWATWQPVETAALARQQNRDPKPAKFLIERPDGSKVWRDRPVSADEKQANDAAFKQRYLESEAHRLGTAHLGPGAAVLPVIDDDPLGPDEMLLDDEVENV